MRPVPFAFLAPLLLLGCAAQDGDAETAARTQSTAAVGEQVNCIDATRIAGRRAPDNRTLEFEMTGGQTFRNTLLETCPGIERASSFGTLAVDPMEARMCRGDTVRVYDPAVIRGSSIKTAPRCRLGAFIRVERSR